MSERSKLTVLLITMYNMISPHRASELLVGVTQKMRAHTIASPVNYPSTKFTP